VRLFPGLLCCILKKLTIAVLEELSTGDVF